MNGVQIDNENFVTGDRKRAIRCFDLGRRGRSLDNAKGRCGTDTKFRGDFEHASTWLPNGDFNTDWHLFSAAVFRVADLTFL